MEKIRTDVENLFLKEMVEEDLDFVFTEDAIDDIIPTNTVGLFDDTSSRDAIEDIDDIDDDNLDIF